MKDIFYRFFGAASEYARSPATAWGVGPESVKNILMNTSNVAFTAFPVVCVASGGRNVLVHVWMYSNVQHS